MTRYSWMIHTAESPPDGELGDVYLALHGLQAIAQELKLPRREFAGGTIESGIIEVRSDLGELQTGSLWTAGSARSAWTPDWIRVMNLTDGRQWTAHSAACDAEGSCPLLQFDRTRDPVEPQKWKEDPGQESDDEVDEKPTGDQDGDDEGRKPRAGRPSGDGSAKDPVVIACTYEIFGKHKGRVVPLPEILQIRAGLKQLTPGAKVLVTDQESQGFGLGGEPGLWEDLYPGVDPALYGLDSDRPVLASDGWRGWVVDAHYLAMIFGAGWRRVVYGN